MGRRHQARELALKVLFELDRTEAEPTDVLKYHLNDEPLSPVVASFAEELVKGVLANRAELDQILVAAAPNWTLDQMAKVDRIILRMAIYEISISRLVPVKAAINESIELAKAYSGEEAGRFVNGVLGTVAARREAVSG